ncbi:MAG TPA: hypothetical protein DCL48_16335, partial [Alphaproteobacteria bacterium]|nr:hypothetical protein [Alphaproteobacteria bacterium]
MAQFSDQVVSLALAAANAMRAGDLANASRRYDEVLKLAPNHPEALFFFGRQAMEARDLTRALNFFRQAAAADPKQPVIQLNISYVAEAMGDTYTQGQALDAAIRADPYFYPAQFARGAYLERMGRPKQAANVYSNALRIAPPHNQLAPTIQAHAIRAKTVVDTYTAQKEAFLQSRTKVARDHLAGEDVARFDESLAIMAG